MLGVHDCIENLNAIEFQKVTRVRNALQLHIGNEYDRLEAVLVHRPGAEIDRLTHENMKRFLFEDIPYLARMQEEHDAFVQTMVEHGIRVFYLEHLLADLLAGEGAIRKRIVEEVCAAENARPIAADLLNGSIVSPDDLLRSLFAGITFERNERTTAALESAGIQCIAVRDSELVRGLGGPRCMTMPLRRSAKP